MIQQPSLYAKLKKKDNSPVTNRLNSRPIHASWAPESITQDGFL